ncbi:MAG: hypothetical protein EXR50_01990 [Dehalococcoidia bacterium]|nr:hypothetical protein [Dehalococcoidia bacterium]
MCTVLPEQGASRSLDGYADLHFAVRGGRTRLVRTATRAPLAVQRALYLDEALPDLAVVFLINTTAGILQGDRLRVAAHVHEGAKALLTSQSATKVYTMPEGEASQHTELVVEPGALLEYLPDPLIPFRGARFTQTSDITVHAGGVLVYSDILSPGRVAHGEALAYSAYRHKLTVRDGGGRPMYHEAFDLNPDAQELCSTGILGFKDASLGTLIVVVSEHRDQLLAALRERLAVATCAFAVSALPAGEGVVVKAIGASLASVRKALYDAWSEVRSTLYGIGPTNLRKY